MLYSISHEITHLKLDKMLFLAYYTSMKKKYLYSLLTTYMATLGALSSCKHPGTSDEKTSQKPAKTYVYKTRIDTVNVTDENFEHTKAKIPGGLFSSSTNTVILKYFQTKSENPHIVKFCKLNNSLHRLILRHEVEHARKRYLISNATLFSCFSRAQVAVANEIVAPAAEIIEAIDYHASTGKRLPQKRFISHADHAISKIPGISMPGYINFNYQPVADAVITYALEGFLDAFSRGYYKSTINKAYNKKTNLTINTPVPYMFFSFNPDWGQWDPIWEFESNAGSCNPYRNASWAVRQKLMRAIDLVTHQATNTGKFKEFYKNDILR